jgi:hypothetical protein
MNFIGLIFILSISAFDSLEYFDYRELLIYPLLNDYFDELNLNMAGKIILFTLFTLLCGLGWLVYCILFHCILAVKYAAKIFIYIFQKKERK